MMMVFNSLFHADCGALTTKSQLLGVLSILRTIPCTTWFKRGVLTCVVLILFIMPVMPLLEQAIIAPEVEGSRNDKKVDMIIEPLCSGTSACSSVSYNKKAGFRPAVFFHSPSSFLFDTDTEFSSCLLDNLTVSGTGPSARLLVSGTLTGYIITPPLRSSGGSWGYFTASGNYTDDSDIECQALEADTLNIMQGNIRNGE
ncbi:MAG: hypothetical protein QW728_06240, partial [Thermoplasmata archaeon]